MEMRALARAVNRRARLLVSGGSGSRATAVSDPAPPAGTPVPACGVTWRAVPALGPRSWRHFLPPRPVPPAGAAANIAFNTASPVRAHDDDPAGSTQQEESGCERATCGPHRGRVHGGGRGRSRGGRNAGGLEAEQVLRGMEKGGRREVGIQALLAQYGTLPRSYAHLVSRLRCPC